MTERFYPPFARFFTSDLKTLPGSTLTFYENGTTTLKAIYTDTTKVTQHPNPITADSAGNFLPIIIDGTYTVVLKNSAGVTQSGWPINNVGGEQVQGSFDTWSAITTYQIGELVTGSDGYRYQATASSLNYDPTDPANVPSKWIRVIFPLSSAYIVYDWSASTAYTGIEYVNRNSVLYKSTQAGTNQDPETAPNYWQRVSNVPKWGTTATYRQYDKAIGSDGKPYVSQQNANTNHDPVGDSGTWWQPEWKQGNAVEVKIKTGGGTLDAYFENRITDASSYTLPAANSVPANAFIIISKSDAAATLSPTVQRAGSDTITWRSGTDTQFVIDTLWADCMMLKSNGSNDWSF